MKPSWLLLFVWFISFICLNQTNQMNQTDHKRRGPDVVGGGQGYSKALERGRPRHVVSRSQGRPESGRQDRRNREHPGHDEPQWPKIPQPLRREHGDGLRGERNGSPSPRPVRLKIRQQRRNKAQRRETKLIVRPRIPGLSAARRCGDKRPHENSGHSRHDIQPSIRLHSEPRHNFRATISTRSTPPTGQHSHQPT